MCVCARKCMLRRKRLLKGTRFPVAFPCLRQERCNKTNDLHVFCAQDTSEKQQKSACACLACVSTRVVASTICVYACVRALLSRLCFAPNSSSRFMNLFLAHIQSTHLRSVEARPPSRQPYDGCRVCLTRFDCDYLTKLWQRAIVEVGNSPLTE